VASLAATQSSARVPRSAAGGVFVLDNCDPDFRGKENYEDNLSFIDPAGKVVFRVSGLNNCESIGSSHMVASDPSRGCAWILENVGHRILKYDLKGKELLKLHEIDANALAVDPASGNVWVLTSNGTIYGESLIVLDDRGQKLANYSVGGFDIAYDKKDKAFWIAGKQLSKFKGEKLIFSKDITTWCASSLAVDQSTGNVWVTVRRHTQVPTSLNELLLFDNDGTIKKTIGIGDKMGFHVSVNSRDGAAWVTMFGHSVQRYSAAGELEAEYEFNAITAEADSTVGGAWVVTPEETLRVDRQGKVQFRVKHKRKTSQAWAAEL
jgi:DNA-binding beta-propeller fold protein YncE